jgi:manganese efflux pump family protein
MGIAALVLWILTAGGGFVMLAQWLGAGGHRASSASRFPPAVIFSHFLLAAAGLVLWIIYLFNGQAALGWAALIVLGVVAVLGLTMFVLWIPSYRGGKVGTGTGSQPPAQASGEAAAAERKFPVAIVAGHGVLAVTTVVLVLLDMLGVGGS